MEETGFRLGCFVTIETTCGRMGGGLEGKKKRVSD